jgi:hypothetical protein
MMLTAGEIASLCEAGAMAPSGGNAQPWQVTASGARLRIGLDPQRSDRSFLDVGGYAALFAIGCFSENVGIAAQSLGLEYTRTVEADAVRFDFTDRRPASPPELYDWIPRRVTNRRLSDAVTLAEADVRRLTALAADVDASCAITALCDPDRQREVARVLGAADVLRMRNAAMFADMVAEICWSEREAADRLDGLDLPTLELPGSTTALLSVLRRLPRLRALIPAGKLADTARSLVLGSSHICCLSTSEAVRPEVMINAGTALQRVWLSATRDGLALQPWTVSTLQLLRLESFGGAGYTARERDTVARIGRDLRAAFDLPASRTPLFVFRLSTAPPPTARSLKRPWQSFTTTVHPAPPANQQGVPDAEHRAVDRRGHRADGERPDSARGV